MMTLHAIDPGPVKSAMVTIWPDGRVEAHTMPNEDIRALVATAAPGRLVIEMIASYGMGVGTEVFETCVWIGRFLETWERQGVHRLPAERLTRIQVKSAICHSANAKDKNIRQALIDHYGGPACIRKGGALYKVKADEWAALAVGVTALNTQNEGM